MTHEDSVIYVATIEITGHRPYKLCLLPDHPIFFMVHQAALEWAVSIGGDLPTRPEQALLFAYQRDQFDRDWYWSSVLHESDLECVWCQNFGNGFQLTANRNVELRARAVRRIYLEETK